MFARKTLRLALTVGTFALASAAPLAAWAAAPVTPADPAARAEWRAQRQAQAAERRAENRAAHAAQCPRADLGAACPAGAGPHGAKAIGSGAPRGHRLHAPVRGAAKPVAPAAPAAPVVPQ